MPNRHIVVQSHLRAGASQTRDDVFTRYRKNPGKSVQTGTVSQNMDEALHDAQDISLRPLRQMGRFVRWTGHQVGGAFNRWLSR